MVAADEDGYGIPPPPAVISAVAQVATLTTRAENHDLDAVVALVQCAATARARGRELIGLPALVPGRTRPTRLDANLMFSEGLDTQTVTDEVTRAHQALSSWPRSTFASRHNSVHTH